MPRFPAPADLRQGLDEKRCKGCRQEDFDTPYAPRVAPGNHPRRSARGDHGLQERRRLRLRGGRTRGELGGSRFEKAAGRLLGPAPGLRLEEARACYHRLARSIRRGLVRSCHDLSDGGLWVALAESSMGGGFGARISLDNLPVSEGCAPEAARLLFCETPSRFLVSVAPEADRAWRRSMKGTASTRIGEVTSDAALRVLEGGREVAAVSLAEARAAWHGEART